MHNRRSFNTHKELTTNIHLLGFAAGDDVEDSCDMVLHESIDSVLDILGLVALVLLGNVMLGEASHLL